MSRNFPSGHTEPQQFSSKRGRHKYSVELLSDIVNDIEHSQPFALNQD